MKKALFFKVRTTRYFLFTLVVLFVCASVNFAELRYDFDDGTFQGWEKGYPSFSPGFAGDLFLQPETTGYSLATGDTTPGGSLFVRGPQELTGDLSGYQSVSLDEWIPSGALGHPQIVLVGANDTYYREIIPTPLIKEVWQNRTVNLSFDTDHWFFWGVGTGQASFEEVLQDVTDFFVLVDVSQTLYYEARLDNIVLNPIPEPATLVLLGLGGLVLRRRKA